MSYHYDKPITVNVSFHLQSSHTYSNMLGTVQDSLFGAFVRLATGARLLGWNDERDESLRQAYLLNATERIHYPQDFPSGISPSLASSNTTLASPAPPSPTFGQVEKDNGKKALLIEWMPDDQGVCLPPHVLPSHLVSFTNDTPVQNPRNWSLAKKCFVTFNICFLTTSVYIGSAIYTAGLRDVMQEFEISQTVAILGLTLYVAGYGLGPMLWAPMSEVPYFGRNPVYIGTLAVFVGFNFAVVYAKNTGMLLAFRFLTGFFGSPVLATGGATIADLYKPSKMPYALAVYGIANVLGPVLGPLVGGFAAEFKGWTCECSRTLLPHWGTLTDDFLRDHLGTNLALWCSASLAFLHPTRNQRSQHPL
jgi:MFS transporter, DHA1 family, multidrug resistance protein